MDFDPSCLLSTSKAGCRKIGAMHVALNAGITIGLREGGKFFVRGVNN